MWNEGLTRTFLRPLSFCAQKPPSDSPTVRSGSISAQMLSSIAAISDGSTGKSGAITSGTGLMSWRSIVAIL